MQHTHGVLSSPPHDGVPSSPPSQSGYSTPMVSCPVHPMMVSCPALPPSQGTAQPCNSYHITVFGLWHNQLQQLMNDSMTQSVTTAHEGLIQVRGTSAQCCAAPLLLHHVRNLSASHVVFPSPHIFAKAFETDTLSFASTSRSCRASLLSFGVLSKYCSKLSAVISPVPEVPELTIMRLY